jgi:hypothetical protein
MRTAGLPTFSKLARRNDNETMVKGTYQIDIYDRRIHSKPQCYVSAIPLLTFGIRFSRYSLWGNQVRSYLNEDRDGWQEPVHGYRVCCRWRNLHCSWCPFHGCAFDQTEVRNLNCYNFVVSYEMILTPFSILRKLGDHTYLTWNNEQPSTATASGRDPRFGSTA